MKNTLHVNSEEFQNFITLKNLEPKEDVKSETNTEMSAINYEDIMSTPSTSVYSVKMKEDKETSGVLITDHKKYYLKTIIKMTLSLLHFIFIN